MVGFMNFITFEELGECIYTNISKVPRNVDLIVGIPRSGTLEANLLALYLNLPFTDIDTLIRKGELRSGSTRKCQNWIKSVAEAEHILVVDDSISSGKAMKEARRKIKEAGITNHVSFLAIYALGVSRNLVDIYFKICEQPRMFEWNYMHHWALEYVCMDIDGVLCEDPSVYQNDDGKNYYDFLINAIPKIIPTQKVGKLVSCRLEKYRKETEEWLSHHNVIYDELYLLPANSAKERRDNFEQAKFKADIYKKSNCVLFIESNYEQAVKICEYSGKQVFSVSNKKLINPDNLIDHIKIIHNDFRITLKRTIKKILGKINYVK